MHARRRMRAAATRSTAFRTSRCGVTARLQSLVCIVAAACGAPSLPGEPDEHVSAEEVPERWWTGAEIDDDLSGDLRNEARDLILVRAAGDGDPERSVSLMWLPPAHIRVWRRALDGSSTSCTGRVDLIPFETYVKGVL